MADSRWNVPHRIVTERLVLRRYEAADAEEMSRVTLASKPHLEPFMPWARAEPLPTEERNALIDTFIAEFDDQRDFAMGMFLRETGCYVGSAGFHTRLGAGVLEIGYWIAHDQQGHGYVTEAVLALTLIALRLAGAERVEIHHAPENVRSRGVPQRCGYSYDGRELTVLPGVPDVEPTDMWFATAEHLASGPLSSTTRPHVFDADGQELAWPA